MAPNTTTNATLTTIIGECDGGTPTYNTNFNDVTKFRARSEGKQYLTKSTQEFLNDAEYSSLCVGTEETLDYFYKFKYQPVKNKLTVSMLICCGNLDGAIFPIDYEAPNGYHAVGTGEAFEPYEDDTGDTSADTTLILTVLFVVS